MASTTARRWLERLVAVAIGSLVTAWWMRGDPSVPTPEIAVLAEAAQTHLPVEGARVVDPPAAIAVDAGPQADPQPVTVIDPAAIPVAAVEAPAEHEQDTDDAPPPGEAPTLELPRMPGSTRLSDASRYDAASKTWVLRAAYRVHARAHHVIAFYSKALADAGLTLSSAEDGASPDGTVIAYVYGRSQKVHAQVSVRTRPGELEARIGILWRVRG